MIILEYPYCGEKLQCIDYYGHTRHSEHYWIYSHSWIEKEGVFINARIKNVIANI